MATKQEIVTNFMVYRDGRSLLGIASIQLPDLEPLNAEISGAGIMGSLPAVIEGHFGLLTMTYNFYTPFDGHDAFSAGEYTTLDSRIAEQTHDSITMTKPIRADKVLCAGYVTKISPGTVQSGQQSTGSIDIGVTSYGLWLEGREILFFDKTNYVYRVNGVDRMGDVRRAIGM